MVKTARGKVSAHKPFISQSTTLHPHSVFLHYRPDVTSVYAARVPFPSETSVHTFGVNGKWQNWNHSGTYCSAPYKQKIALFSLSGCISSSHSEAIIYVCSFTEISAEPCQLFSVPYVHLCN